jgi:uncharacterized RmlC-like cupin family protein
VEYEKVITINSSEVSWESREWGVDHLPVIKSETMEMHKKRVLSNSVGIPHIHHYETLYHVLEGELISISGDNLEHVEVQKCGSYVHVPKGLLHTVANVTSNDAITLVAHNVQDVENKCTTFADKQQLAQNIIEEYIKNHVLNNR